jgi:hypothetical protein
MFAVNAVECCLKIPYGICIKKIAITITMKGVSTMIKLNPLLLIALTQDFLNAALEPESYLSEKTIGEFETEEGFFQLRLSLCRDEDEFKDLIVGEDIFDLPENKFNKRYSLTRED